MKRIQLFEFEDLPWLPSAVRDSMTRMLTLLHSWLGSKEHVAELLFEVAQQTGRKKIVDYCSGDGGAMPDVLRILRDKYNTSASLVLTDLYPNKDAVTRIANFRDPHLTYCKDPVDATEPLPLHAGAIRTMVCSFHHMPPAIARAILKQASESGDPIIIYELSDNSAPPKYLWWIGLPLNLLFGFFVAARVRPMSPKHFFFSFLVPIIPICFAWDGAVSNARTYTQADLDELLEGVHSEGYRWTKGKRGARPMQQLYCIGVPVPSETDLASQRTIDTGTRS